MRPVFFYVSGHGFGHASRQIEIMRALARLAPRRPIVVRTAAAGWLFDRTAPPGVTVIPGETDAGAVQIDSLHLDVAATVARALAFHDTIDARADADAALLERHDAGLVIADVPPLACLAAARRAVPSIVVGNFTWDWIYAGYAPEPGVDRLVAATRDAYARADEAWRLPLHGGFEGIRHIRDVPFVARHAAHGRHETRARLGLPADRPLVLVSFGGFGLEQLDAQALDCLDRWGVLIPHAGDARGRPAHVFPFRDDEVAAAGLRYEDLVAAVDVVLTKPGYGIIAECIANGAAMLYTSRGRFAEYDVLVQGLPRYLRARYLSQDDLFAGRWRAALDALEAEPSPPERPRTDGASVIASLIEDRLAAGRESVRA